MKDFFVPFTFVLRLSIAVSTFGDSALLSSAQQRTVSGFKLSLYLELLGFMYSLTNSHFTFSNLAKFQLFLLT